MMVWTVVKAIGSFLVAPVSGIINKYFTYLKDRKVVEGQVLVQALKSTESTQAYILKLQLQEIKNKWFFRLKMSFMFLAFVYVGAHVLQSIAVLPWEVHTLPASISIWFGWIMMYLFMAGNNGVLDVIMAWLLRSK